MSKASEATGTRDAVETLLERAAPRPVPPADDGKRVRDAVFSEWQAVTSRHRSHRRLRQFALAASVVLAVAAAYNIFLVDQVAPVEVASIDKSHGTIYLLGKQSRLDPIDDLEAISAGQVIETGENAGIGLAWGNGGSLRIDSRTRIEFTSATTVHLAWGRVYFDAESSDAEMTVQTDHGAVTHIGTQYMAAADADTLSVSVREGRIEVEGKYYDEFVREGYRMQMKGNARPTKSKTATYGDSWEWVEATSPALQLDGKTIHEFLVWVSRETGFGLQYEGQAAVTAKAGRLIGTVDKPPREELHLRMLTADLAYRIDGGTIYVTTND